MIIRTHEYTSPVGILMLGSTGSALCLSDWKHRALRMAIDKRITTYFNAEVHTGVDDVIHQAVEELDDYFSGVRMSFTVPLVFAGTKFQKAVWEKLITIPYGATRSYFELSTSLHSPSALRAVASANGANALSIFVPCHRVIGTDGSLTGYAGGLATKHALLTLEKKHSTTDEANTQFQLEW